MFPPRLFLPLLAALLLAASPLRAGGGGEAERHPLVGVWQYIYNVYKDGTSHLHYRSFLKIFGADGSFCNVTFQPGGMACTSQRGTFEVLSDSTYVERITYSVDPRFSGRDSRLFYRLTHGGEQLTVLWFDTGGGVYVPELWRRVGNVPGE